MKYHIKPKRDFGGSTWLINGRRVSSGFVVTDGFCNVMPGACWFETIREALNGIECLIRSGGDSDTFWRMMRD